jgi:hypothetical protein
VAEARESPNKPRPADPLVREAAALLAAIERNYEREGSGPGSRFEGRLLEDVQAEAVVRLAQDPAARKYLALLDEATQVMWNTGTRPGNAGYVRRIRAQAGLEPLP